MHTTGVLVFGGDEGKSAWRSSIQPRAVLSGEVIKASNRVETHEKEGSLLWELLTQVINNPTDFKDLVTKDSGEVVPTHFPVFRFAEFETRK